MKKDEVVAKNISLTFDFVRNIIDDPETLGSIPDGAVIEFVETDLPSYISGDRIQDKTKRALFRVEHTFRGIVADK